MPLFFLLLLTVSFISGCATRGNNPQEIIHSPNSTDAVRVALYEEYEKWKSTPYKYGGESKSGVDCSSFVQSMYYNALRVHVPRTTALQEKSGYFVSKKRLREGDLLIFRTSYTTKHSGIYIEKGKFVHASSKYGVSISSVNNPYWRAKYSQARRVLNY